MSQDFGLAAEEPAVILGRIEDLIVDFVDALSQGQLPALQVPTLRRASKRPLALHEEDGNHLRSSQIVMTEVSLTAKQGASAFRYTRVFKMLAVVHELVRTARWAPQRDIFYQLKNGQLFTSPRQVADAIEGMISIKQETGDWMDCHSIRAIPGDLQAIQAFNFRSEARHLVIVEKDAVFQRLVEEDFCAATDTILVTAKGMPDLASRLFLRMLSEAFPDLILAAVVDWNPSGIAILKTYKYGSENSLQGSEYQLPSLHWLGLHASQVDCLPETAFQPLSQHDRSVIRSLNRGPLRELPRWMHEIRTIEMNGAKAEIEAAYSHFGYGAFVRDLTQRLLEGMYI